MVGYIKCQRSKVDRHSRQTKSILKPTGEYLFEEIAMDLLRELSESEAFKAILVIIDWFTKVQY